MLDEEGKATITDLEILLEEIEKAGPSMLTIAFNTIQARPEHWLGQHQSIRYLIKYMREHG